MGKLCSYFGISRSGYYKSLKERQKEEQEGLLIEQLIQSTRKRLPRIGGKKVYKLLTPDLEQNEVSIGRDRFLKIYKKSGFQLVRRKSFIRTTMSYHRFYKHSNKIRELSLNRSHQVYVSDITYLRTRQGFVYLFLITDAYSRKIVGWHLSKNLSMEGPLMSLRMALGQCPNPAQLIHHSDRGIHYCNKEYTSLLEKYQTQISMTEENHCYENALAERVNGILKDEFLLGETLPDYATAFKSVKEAIHYYNSYRPHWSLNLLTPQAVHALG